MHKTIQFFKSKLVVDYVIWSAWNYSKYLASHWSKKNCKTKLFQHSFYREKVDSEYKTKNFCPLISRLYKCKFVFSNFISERTTNTCVVVWQIFASSCGQKNLLFFVFITSILDVSPKSIVIVICNLQFRFSKKATKFDEISQLTK